MRGGNPAPFAISYLLRITLRTTFSLCFPRHNNAEQHQKLTELGGSFPRAKYGCLCEWENSGHVIPESPPYSLTNLTFFCLFVLGGNGDVLSLRSNICRFLLRLLPAYRCPTDKAAETGFFSYFFLGKGNTVFLSDAAALRPSLYRG